MENKLKAKKEIARIFQLAEETATVPLPVPTYLPYIRFELLFLFLFLLDYREYIKFEQSQRDKIIDEFIIKIADELSGEREMERATTLYQKRIDDYFAITKNSKKVGDFLKSVSEYIEALYIEHSEHKLSSKPFISNNEEESMQELISKMKGELIEPLSISIAMNAKGLI